MSTPENLSLKRKEIFVVLVANEDLENSNSKGSHTRIQIRANSNVFFLNFISTVRLVSWL